MNIIKWYLDEVQGNVKSSDKSKVKVFYYKIIEFLLEKKLPLDESKYQYTRLASDYLTLYFIYIKLLSSAATKLM